MKNFNLLIIFITALTTLTTGADLQYYEQGAITSMLFCGHGQKELNSVATMMQEQLKKSGYNNEEIVIFDQELTDVANRGRDCHFYQAVKKAASPTKQ